MKNTFLIIAASLFLSGCSLLAPPEPPAPVAVKVPVETTGPVTNPAYPPDDASQNAAYTADAEECNALAVQTGIPSKECLKTKGWKNIK